MTNTKTPDLTLTGSLLVAQFNEMVATATDLGLTGFREVNRFATSKAGQERTTKLHAAIQAKVLEDAGETDPEVIEEKTGLHPLDQGDTSSRLDNALAGAEVCADSDTANFQAETTSEGNTAQEETSEEALERLPDETEEAHMARKTAAKKSKKKGVNTKPRKAATGTGKRVKSADGTTVREKTEEYNRMVPAAKKAGITWAKHHTSNFESQTKADVALKKLKDAIKKA